MVLLGSIIAIGAAAVFVLVAALVWWGVSRALRGELRPGLRSVPLPPGRRVLTVLAIALPAAGAALLALLAAGRILLVAVGAG
jgi:hypothetical protein